MKLEELRRLRVAAGIPQVEMANHLGLTQGGYSMKERGKSEFVVSEIQELARVLHLSMEQVNDLFFGGTVEEHTGEAEDLADATPGEGVDASHA